MSLIRDRKQDQAIAALLECVSVREAAEKTGIAFTTLVKMMARPEFDEALRSAQRKIRDEAIRRMSNASVKAVETLERNLDCGNESVEVRAAIGILSFLSRVVDQDDVLKRVHELEGKFSELNEAHSSRVIPIRSETTAGGAS